MHRLHQELQRLYGPRADSGQDPDTDAHGLADVQGRAQGQAQGRVRAMVLELARPADWAALSAAWGGVQADLALPAPAIAVNGRDGCQLWFSLAEPVSAARAGAFLDALRRRYLGGVAPARLAMLPMPDGIPAGPPMHAPPVPALQATSGMWSAFVAPDLAPMFADEPWLDGAPNLDGQAQLLAQLKSIPPAAFEQALQQLGPAAAPAAAAPASLAAAPGSASLDPRRFLLDVMNNDGLDLALRIEAAKALLPHVGAAGERRREPGGGRGP